MVHIHDFTSPTRVRMARVWGLREPKRGRGRCKGEGWSVRKTPTDTRTLEYAPTVQWHIWRVGQKRIQNACILYL